MEYISGSDDVSDIRSCLVKGPDASSDKANKKKPDKPAPKPE